MTSFVSGRWGTAACTLALIAPSLEAQAPTYAPLPASGIEDLQDVLDLAQLRYGGSPPAIEVRGTRLEDLAALEEASPDLRPWADRLGEGPVPRTGDSGPFHYAAALRGGGRWGSDLLLDPGKGAFVGVTARAGIGTRLGFAVEAMEGGWGHAGGIRELVVTARAAGAVVSVGRTRPRLGPGRDDLLLPGTLPLDGVEIASERPFRLPGFLGAIGSISAAGSLRALDETGAVDDPWYGALALSLDPTENVRVGVARTAAFGGEGRPRVTADRLIRLLAGRHSTDVGEFEDQYAQLFARVRIEPFGLPLLLYAAIAVNDTEGAIGDDPGLLAGLVLPLAPRSWFGTLRYEYVGFGESAGACFWCAGGRPRTWFDHYIYGAHAVDGLPIASTLGGYGTRHLIRWRGWDPGAAWSIESDLFRERREPTNLLEDRWPGVRWGGTVGLGLHTPEVVLRARAGAALDADDEVFGSLELSVEWTGVRR